MAFRWVCRHSEAVLWLNAALEFVDRSDGSILAGKATKLDISLLRLLREQISHQCAPAIDGE